MNAPIEVSIGKLQENEEGVVCDMIRRNLSVFEEAGSVLAASYRRLDGLYRNYQDEGHCCLVARAGDQIAGAAGIGPLAGLPLSEGYGEIRDLVIEPHFRGQGIGARLLDACIRTSHEFGFRKLYLKTTPKMQHAQRLFERVGFRAVVQNTQDKNEVKTQGLPCYYLLEEIEPSKGV